MILNLLISVVNQIGRISHKSPFQNIAHFILMKFRFGVAEIKPQKLNQLYHRLWPVAKGAVDKIWNVFRWIRISF